jgi:ribosome-associated protein
MGGGRQEVNKAVIMAAKAAYDKKGENILLLELKKIAPFLCDYFLIVTGNSKEHLRAIADHIEEKLAEIGVYPDHLEGYEVGRWILMDFLDFVIHIMNEEARQYYDLEYLWGDAPAYKYPEDFVYDIKKEAGGSS